MSKDQKDNRSVVAYIIMSWQLFALKISTFIFKDFYYPSMRGLICNFFPFNNSLSFAVRSSKLNSISSSQCYWTRMVCSSNDVFSSVVILPNLIRDRNLGILGNYLFLKETKSHDLNSLQKDLFYLVTLPGHSQHT